MTQTEFFDRFFSEESKKELEDLSSVSTEGLLAMLDDIVQVLCMESNDKWSLSNDIAHKTFRELKSELARRCNHG